MQGLRGVESVSMYNHNLTEKQQQVFDIVKKRICNKPWFKGVCVDNFPTDKEIDEDFSSAVNMVEMETEMWDDPNFGIWGNSDD
jgi:hypothetical protein